MIKKADVLLGLQWGDEGKGKIVDVLTPKYDIIGRFQGGPNAGHTLEFNGIKHVLHTIPSGIFHEKSINIIGNGVVIDPVIFQKEIAALKKLGVDVSKRLLLSKRAHLILPTHRLIDAASEAAKGKGKIGSTLKGIGPTYMDKTGRNGLRGGDISMPDFKEKYHALVEKHAEILKRYNFKYNLAELEPAWMEGIEVLKTIQHIESEHFINQALAGGKSVLAEGAQGSMLDIDFGSYPFVTSSSTICAGACTGLGIAPNKIGEVLGIFKAYCTRVGSGPFPTELSDATGELIRKTGNEFGSTTGRPRRCGWLDLPLLRYSNRVNSSEWLVVTKLDVLDELAEIPICTVYRIDGKMTDEVPADLAGLQKIEPVYTSLKGWQEKTEGITEFEKLPKAAQEYLRFQERESGAKIGMVSTGPDREQTMFLPEFAAALESICG